MRAVNNIKQQANDILLANLRYDVQLKLVDPHVEIARMYPYTVAPSTTAAATTALYAHFVVTRDQCVNQSVHFLIAF